MTPSAPAAAGRTVARLKSVLGRLAARHWPSLWEAHWLRRSRQYWIEGWRKDPRGLVNAPDSYWSNGDPEASYTPDLLAAVKAVGHSGEIGSFLELGCNAGRNLFNLANGYPKARIVGIDINPAAIEFMRRNPKAQSQWDLRVADLTDPVTLGSFGDSEIDVIYSMAVLVHIPPGAAKARLIRECLRICKKALILIEPPSPAGGLHVNTAEGPAFSPFFLDDYPGYLRGVSFRTALTHRGENDIYRVQVFAGT